MSYYVPNEAALPCYHVGKGQEYPSFTQCVWSLRDDHREKIIYVHPGEYDIFEEYRQSDIPRPPEDMPSVHAYRPYNAILSENTHVIGIGIVVFRYMPTKEQTNPTESQVVSVLNLAASATVENIEIHVKNGRYCIHDETLGIPEFSGAQKRYKDVVCHRYENDEGYGCDQCIGFGFDDKMVIEFDDCEFYSHNSGAAFYMHNRARSGDRFTPLAPGEVRPHIPYLEEENSRITVRHCIIDAEDPNAMGVEFGNCVKEGHHVRVRFDSCYFRGPIRLQDEATDFLGTKKNSFDLCLLHCSAADIQIADPENRFPPRIYP